METFDVGVVQDLRCALRGLKRQPASPLLALLLMTLAIGASTTLFSVAHGVLVRPLPWPHSDRLVRVSDIRKAAQDPSAPTISNMSYLAWATGATTIDGLAVWSSFDDLLSIGGDLRRAQVASVSPNLFSLLGVRPAAGSGFAPQDGTPGGRRVAILSYGLWQTQFAGRREVIGSAIQIDQRAYTVVGIMPKSFAYPDAETCVWRPMEPVKPVVCGPSCRSFMSFHAIARLKPGVTAEQAAAEATARVRQTDPAERAAFSDDDRPRGIAVVPLLAAATSTVRPAIIVFLVAVSLLLITAIWNVAGLQLARAVSRRREVAIRSALGGSAGRLARQFLVESLCVGMSAGVLGVLLARLACRLAPTLLPPTFPRLDNVAISLPALAFALVASLVSSVAIGVLPAWFARRPDLVQVLAHGAPIFRGRSGRSTVWIRRTLVAGQMAAACLLLLGSALLIRNFVGLLTTNLGFEPARVLTARIWLRDAKGAEQNRFLDELVRRVHTMPSVASAAVALDVPLDSLDPERSLKVSSAQGGALVQVRAAERLVSLDYFKVLGTRLVAGRMFSHDDLTAPTAVVIVNRAFAARYFGGQAQDRFVEQFPRRLARIVGVVEDVRQRNIAEDPSPAVYRLYRQPPGGSLTLSTAMLFVRAGGEPSSLAPKVQAAVREMDASVVVDRVQTLEELRATKLRQPQLYAVLLGTLAFSSLVIAVVGLSALVAYSVTVRWKEMGVRLALGASPTDIVRLVLREVMAIAVPGIVVGGVAALGLVKSLSSFLYGMSEYDPVSFLCVPVAVLAVVIFACLTPALRAARMDAAQTLRC